MGIPVDCTSKLRTTSLPFINVIVWKRFDLFMPMKCKTQNDQPLFSPGEGVIQLSSIDIYRHNNALSSENVKNIYYSNSFLSITTCVKYFPVSEMKVEGK